jgi:glutathione S-transferase
MQPVRIIGSYLSPYVRKVLVCLELKSLPYRIDPIVPFYGNEEFSRLSPLRRVPVLIDDRVTLCDSTVICEYLEERYPQPALYPATPEQRAQARWLEEFADTRMGEVFIWRLFNEVVIKPNVWGKETDQEVLRKTLEEDAPSVLDYLETRLPGDGWLFGSICVADIAIASFFRNAAFANYRVDAARWPGSAAFVARTLEHPAFVRLRPFEDLLCRTRIGRAREALREAGAPISDQSLALDTPRAGMLSR